MSPVEAPIEKWTGKIRELKLGAGGRKSVVVGGASSLPFVKFEGVQPHRPAVAIEVRDVAPKDWSPLLVATWGDALKDPSMWAKRAAEFGADLLYVRLASAHPEEGNTGAMEAKKTAANILAAVDLPLIFAGPDVAEKDNEVLVAVSDVSKGQRVGLANCVEKNHKTIAATCLADGHVAIAKSPIEINLAKQLNILLTDIGLAPDSILMDPTTGALGYGLEYSYSVMERLRLAALMGDAMTSMPMISTVGEESWRQKESKASEAPKSWGKDVERALVWEELTAIGLLAAGADIVVLRHPHTVSMIKSALDRLFA
jgi:acetyl-CoA decarbonylase/synthase, CODH/ACS complex subunit delta